MSKTKWGASIAGIGLILGTVAGWLNGTIDAAAAISALLAEIGTVVTLWGIRDWPIINSVLGAVKK